jgi:hypothetical protein
MSSTILDTSEEDGLDALTSVIFPKPDEVRNNYVGSFDKIGLSPNAAKLISISIKDTSH